MFVILSAKLNMIVEKAAAAKGIAIRFAISVILTNVIRFLFSSDSEVPPKTFLIAISFSRSVAK